MRLIISLNLIQIYSSVATGFTIPDYESVRGPLECLDMKRVEGKFVYEETQQKTAPVDYPKSVGIVGDYNEYYDEQQCAIFLMTDMSNIIDLRITLHNDNCAVCDVDYEGDFVCDEVKVIDGWFVNGKTIPQLLEDVEPKTTRCGQTMRFQSTSNVAMIQFSLNYKVKFTLDWVSKPSPVPICNVVNTNNTGTVSITHDSDYNTDCSLTVLDPVSLQFENVHTSAATSDDIIVDVTVFEGSLNNNSELGPTGYYECTETSTGAYCTEHDQLNSKPLGNDRVSRKKNLSIGADYSVISIKSRGNLKSTTLDMSFSPN